MHEQGTPGRRIQEGRKAAGLSQEALGERLNVPRRAVSKWEADAAKYAEEAQRHQRPRWTKRRKTIAAGMAAALVLAAGILMKRQIDAINKCFDEVQNQIERSAASQAGSLTGQMSNILDEKINILYNSQATVTDFDPGAQTVTLRLSASPKEWTNTTAVRITDGHGQSAWTVLDACENDSGKLYTDLFSNAEWQPGSAATFWQA